LHQGASKQGASIAPLQDKISQKNWNEMTHTVQKKIHHSRLLLLTCGFVLTCAAASFADEPAAPEIPEAAPAAAPAAVAEQQEQTFTIKRFIIEGSALFPPEELQKQVKQYAGRLKTAADVEGARDALERFFHDQGYPTVMVNIPEQAVLSKVIRLEIIENRVGTVTVTGNRWFSTEKILRELPSIAPGQVIKLQDLQQEAGRINRNPDFKVVPEMQPGKAPESVDMSLKVTEQLPLHGSLELNNRCSHDTTRLRLNSALRYDNLWQRDHSLAAQLQTSPEKLKEVLVASGTYTMPAFWDRDDKIVVYGVWSNTDTASGAGYNNLGKGHIYGSRLIVPLRGIDSYNHTAVFGIDYKDFKEMLIVGAADGVRSPATYAPLSFAYSGSLQGDSGVTGFNAGLTMAFRTVVTDPREFEDKRYKARGNYIALTAGVERSQKIPGGFTLLAKLDGQLTDQPLIANEQFTAGGVESVRGYRESEASGDNALHGTFELAAPDLLKNLGRERFSLSPYVFYDGAGLWLKNPLAGQDSLVGLEGAGIGMRGTLFGSFEYQTDLAFALLDTNRIQAGDAYLHFKVKWQF
jgi:hemolysin activation/secretion protein